MRTHTLPFRATAALVAVGLLFGTGFSPAAFAQSEAVNIADPPSRVGRLARLAGQVSFRTGEADQWETAALNYPITSDNVVWTEPRGQAEIQIEGDRVVLDASTEFEMITLDDRAMVASARRGELYLNLRSSPDSAGYTIRTPRGAVSIAGAGRYGVIAGDTSNPTRVTVIEGAAVVTSETTVLQVSANQTATISGSDRFEASIGPAVMDPFLRDMVARERAPPRPVVVGAVVAPPMVELMTGARDLDNYGSWNTSSDYGRVWYPRVEVDYVPYRHGHWSFVTPWGWTWIDDAPWGFAPFHYGRWVQVNSRWGWVPTAVRVQGVPEPVYRRPVYAPALVNFFALGVAIGVGAAVIAGRGRDDGPRGSVGWVPLGPQEVFRPAYRTSPDYVRNVNVTQVTNITTINNVTNNTTINNIDGMVNRRAATVVPATAMATSLPVAAARQSVSSEHLARATVVAAPAAAAAMATPVPVVVPVPRAGSPAVVPTPAPVTAPAALPAPRREANRAAQVPGPVVTPPSVVAPVLPVTAKPGEPAPALERRHLPPLPAPGPAKPAGPGAAIPKAPPVAAPAAPSAIPAPPVAPPVAVPVAPTMVPGRAVMPPAAVAPSPADAGKPGKAEVPKVVAPKVEVPHANADGRAIESKPAIPVAPPVVVAPAVPAIVAPPRAVAKPVAPERRKPEPPTAGPEVHGAYSPPSLGDVA